MIKLRIFILLYFLSVLFYGITAEVKDPHKRKKINIAFTKIASGFKKPTDIQFVPGKSSAIVLEQEGVGYLLNVNTGQSHKVIDLSDQVISKVEEGLLGLAFHPKFKTNRLFYLNYVVKKGGKDFTTIAEFKTDKDFTQVIRKPEKILLQVEQPYTNHNGGQIAFGQDGFLYIGFGDGGYRNDPYKHGQNTQTFLGTLIRIDVDKQDKDKHYAIPEDNPFVKKEGFLPEIWAYGFRNPWRFSFDKKDGRLFLGDVGQDEYEEVNIVVKSGNYGWNVREGNHCFKSNPECGKKKFHDPLIEYNHKDGISVTGGYVYYGKKIPELYGYYVFGDYGFGKIWALKIFDEEYIDSFILSKTPFNISTFGQDSKSNLYVADYSGGAIYKIIPKKTP
ncbi:MAG: PQQ-dependent sugar dehydrogenase [Leptospiraceae bacterium]|nr:PQQ-dependent sugar dehydrogenase [Leptospiraceae bacterium]MCP5495929.1 PQQ-dependent sugar dehydrogenase [Leptospiraceae bacterium]